MEYRRSHAAGEFGQTTLLLGGEDVVEYRMLHAERYLEHRSGWVSSLPANQRRRYDGGRLEGRTRRDAENRAERDMIIGLDAFSRWADECDQGGRLVRGRGRRGRTSSEAFGGSNVGVLVLAPITLYAHASSSDLASSSNQSVRGQIPH